MATEHAPSSPNRLAGEKSPYLLQHRHNPVDWLPWGEEAFEKARREDKPIFLSVGYSTCHWCHVMAHESFEDPAIGELLNAHFVSIKVDREERPDVDRIYMTYVQATTGQGGWPMSVWLTPELKPFYGGTYFPPDERFGRPGFASLLRSIAASWKNDRATIEAQGNHVVEALQRYLAASRTPGEAPGIEAVRAGFRRLTEMFDSRMGGFGGAPKFPRPVNLALLFRLAAPPWEEAMRRDALSMALLSLRRMAQGGIHDHVGGGFHRYAVDGNWHVPHFEKMLYDQAQLAASYVEAFQLTGRPVYAWVARGTLDYVLRDLTSPDGGFYSAEDADSRLRHDSPEHAEGAFYVWTQAELQAALGEDADLVARHFGVEEGGNVPAGADPQGELKGRNVLIQRQSLTETAGAFGLEPDAASDRLVAALLRLRAEREKRPRPHLDDKIICAWNGLMISAFARAAQALAGGADSPAEAYAAAASSAAGFIEENLYDSERRRLFRSFREGRSAVPGFADDYAFLIQGLLDLYETTFERRWLAWAAVLQGEQDALFWDSEGGGYFQAGQQDRSILLRLKEDYDGAEPSPNSIAALNLLRLARMLGDEPAGGGSRRRRAEETMAAFRTQCENTPEAMPQMLVAIADSAASPPQIIVAGDSAQDENARALLRVAARRHLPGRVLLLAEPGTRNWLAESKPEFREFVPIGGKAAAYVCRDFTCQRPVQTVEELEELLS